MTSSSAPIYRHQPPPHPPVPPAPLLLPLPPPLLLTLQQPPLPQCCTLPPLRVEVPSAPAPFLPRLSTLRPSPPFPRHLLSPPSNLCPRRLSSPHRCPRPSRPSTQRPPRSQLPPPQCQLSPPPRPAPTTAYLCLLPLLRLSSNSQCSNNSTSPPRSLPRVLLLRRSTLLGPRSRHPCRSCRRHRSRRSSPLPEPHQGTPPPRYSRQPRPARVGGTELFRRPIRKPSRTSSTLLLNLTLTLVCVHAFVNVNAHSSFDFSVQPRK